MGVAPRQERIQPSEGVKLDGTQPIGATVTVRSDPARAFELFTAQMGKWWPLESYSRR